MVTGIVYCSVISGYQRRLRAAARKRVDRRASDWCEPQPDSSPFPGHPAWCAVPELMQLRGAWARSARTRRALSQASDSPSARTTAGLRARPYYRQGEILRLQGDLASQPSQAYRVREPETGARAAARLRALAARPGRDAAAAAGAIRACPRARPADPAARRATPARRRRDRARRGATVRRRARACDELRRGSRPISTTDLLRRDGGSRPRRRRAGRRRQAARRRWQPLRDAWAAWQRDRGPLRGRARPRCAIALACRRAR